MDTLMLILIFIMAAIVALVVIDFYICEPLPSATWKKIIKEERELGRELYHYEMIERGYQTKLFYKWVSFRMFLDV